MTINSAALCACGEPHNGWPGKDGREVCQMCWEKETSESWWGGMARAIEEYGPLRGTVAGLQLKTASTLGEIDEKGKP